MRERRSGWEDNARLSPECSQQTGLWIYLSVWYYTPERGWRGMAAMSLLEGK